MAAELINRIAFIVLVVGLSLYLAIQCYLQFSWLRLTYVALPGLFFATMYLLVQKGTELQLWIAAGILAAFMVIILLGGIVATIVFCMLKKEK